MHVIESEIIMGERVYLRPLTLSHATDTYCAWLNDPEVNEFLETRHSTIEELRQYIQKQIDDPNSFFVGIFDKNKHTHIGNIKLEPIDWQNKKAIFGILIGDKEYWGKGIGTEATLLVVRYAFDTLGLEEIELGVIVHNKRAIRSYEKAGFAHSGIRKQAINHDGVLHDAAVMRMRKPRT
mgnify:CR=1 FL=1